MSRYAASSSKFHEAFSITARPHMKQDTVPSLINAYEVWLQKINKYNYWPFLHIFTHKILFTWLGSHHVNGADLLFQNKHGILLHFIC